MPGWQYDGPGHWSWEPAGPGGPRYAAIRQPVPRETSWVLYLDGEGTRQLGVYPGLNDARLAAQRHWEGNR